MKKISLYIFATLFIAAFAFRFTSAQFSIKVPKLPKTEKPKTEQPKIDGDSPSPPNGASRKNQSGNEVGYMARPEPDATSRFMLDTLEITAKTEPRYWKAPNQNDNSSWYPRVLFRTFYNHSQKMRYTAEWFNPNGSTWFTEQLDSDTYGDAAHETRVLSPPFAQQLNPEAVQTTGTYGLKITNAKTGETVFQGKFKVNKLSTEPSKKNKSFFYVDQDWNLPIGYVGFDYSGFTSWSYDPKPIVFMWFKGNLDAKNFEARLFHNNQQIASTDEGGTITIGRERNSDCYESPEVCKLNLWVFNWERFKIESFDKVEHQYSTYVRDPKAVYTKDKPGEYTFKIFYKGVQVREAKFTFDAKGWMPPNPYANQIYLNNLKVPVAVKVMGNLEKTNSATWKTDAFYGNPLTER